MKGKNNREYNLKIDAPFYANLPDAAKEAKRIQDLGFDGLYTLEGSWDPFLPLALATEHAPLLDIATAVAIAFPRNPMHTAYQAWDLQKFSRGKFTLGLGSQIKTHIEKRFGTDFHPPASRMRDYIQALKSIFKCWQEGSRLDYQGEFYRHTLMTPMFNPGANEFGVPSITMGALGPKMTEVAGEVADGLIVHPFNNESFVRENTLPALDLGIEKSDRDRSDISLNVHAIVITGESEEEMNDARDSVKKLLGFYGSTPAYLAPMDSIGYGALQPELNQLSKKGKWNELGEAIDEGFLEAFCVEGEPSDLASKLINRHGGYADRIGLYAPYNVSDNIWRQLLSDLKD